MLIKTAASYAENRHFENLSLLFGKEDTGDKSEFFKWISESDEAKSKLNSLSVTFSDFRYLEN